MLNNQNIDLLQSDRLKPLPNVNSLLKISLGLMLFTIISTAFVYAETISVDVGGDSYDIDYAVSGMTVSDIEADEDFISLILTVDVSDSPGTLDITFDRTFFDSTYEGLDDDFIVLADGDEPPSSETNTTSQSRTLNIELPAGTEEVEIIGSVFGAAISTPAEETPEEPVKETPEEPVKETPEEPVKETPEEPVKETPEEPVEDKPITQCGSGTILKDGVCVLDERCGPGTILQDGACVLESIPASSEVSIKGMGKEMVMGVIAAFVVAGIIGIILALMSKASKSKN